MNPTKKDYPPEAYGYVSDREFHSHVPWCKARQGNVFAWDRCTCDAGMTALKNWHNDMRRRGLRVTGIKLPERCKMWWTLNLHLTQPDEPYGYSFRGIWVTFYAK